MRRHWPLLLLPLIVLMGLLSAPTVQWIRGSRAPAVEAPETPASSRTVSTVPVSEAAALETTPVSDSTDSLEEFGPLDSPAGGGPTRPTRSAVLDGLIWLMKNQNEDGSWGRGSVAFEGGTLDETGLTALALLALLGAGYTHLSRDTFEGYQAGVVVKKALEWLMRNQYENGSVNTAGDRAANQALAAMALSEAYGMTNAAFLKEPAQKAVTALLDLQSSDGSWGLPWITLWAGEALYSARASELALDGDRCRRADEYFRREAEREPRDGTSSLPALFGHFMLNRDKTHPAIAETCTALARRAQAGELQSPLEWYASSMALFQYDGPAGPTWERWNEPAKNAIVPAQSSDGSWPGRSVNEILLHTSISTLTLEVYYRFGNVFGS